MSLRASRRVGRLQRTLIRRIFDEAPADAINLGLGQPDLATPPVAALAGVRGIAEGRTGYTSTAGEPALRRAIAEHYGPEQLPDGAAGVLVTIGSQEAMFVACLGLVDPGDEVLYPDPGYPAYPVVAELAGARPVPYPLQPARGFRVEPTEIESRLSERTRAVMLCAPSNPTGACPGEPELQELTRLLGSRGIGWISDEVYAGFCYDRPFVSPARFGPGGGLIVSSLSKDACMTGWRVGWVAGPESIVRRLTAAHQYLVTCASSVSQAAALAAFSPQGLRTRRQYLERFRQRREVMREELARIPGLGFAPPDGAFYYFVDVSAHGDSTEIARRLLQRGVVTIPGEAFGGGGTGFLRLSFAASESDIREGVRRLAALLAGS